MTNLNSPLANSWIPFRTSQPCLSVAMSNGLAQDVGAFSSRSHKLCVISNGLFEHPLNGQKKKPAMCTL